MLESIKLNVDVSIFLDKINHPFRKEIELLRLVLLNAHDGIEENIKWNGPNYTVNGDDRITMRVQPPKQNVQLIFHRGSKKLEQPKSRLITESSGLLTWKENDRAIVTFQSLKDIDA